MTALFINIICKHFQVKMIFIYGIDEGLFLKNLSGDLINISYPKNK